MKYLLLLALLTACEKPEIVHKRGTRSPQGEEPAPSEPQDSAMRFQLTWKKAPRPVTQYEIRFGLTETSIAEKIMSVDTAHDFDVGKPAAVVTIGAERLMGQSQACFQIVATNTHGTSEPSDARCLPLP